MNTIIRLTNGQKVKVWSDNSNCTLHVFDVEIEFDADTTMTTQIPYSTVHPDDMKKLAFYKFDPECPPEII